MSPNRPPFVLRLAVVVGGVSLLLGMVSAGILIVRGDAAEPAAGPGLRPRVRLRGAALPPTARVEVRWAEGEVVVTQPALRLRKGGEVWLLPTGPGIGRATLLVREDEAPGSRLLFQRTVEIDPGGETVVDLAARAPDR